MGSIEGRESMAPEWVARSKECLPVSSKRGPNLVSDHTQMLVLSIRYNGLINLLLWALRSGFSA